MSHLQPPANPVAAVTHPDPYPYYASLVETAPLYFDRGLSAWVVSSAPYVDAILSDPRACVRPPREPVPAAIADTTAGSVFAQLVRMNDGAAHRSLRPRVESRLAGFAATAGIARELPCDTRDVNDFAARYSVYALAALLAIPPADMPRLYDEARAFTRCIVPTPGQPPDPGGSAAAAALLERFGDANTAGFFFQTFDATRGLIANALAAARTDTGDVRALLEATLQNDSPVQNTRRFLKAEMTLGDTTLQEGDAVLVVLAAANRDPAGNGQCFTFGAGAHACPGKELALSIAAGALRQLFDDRAGLSTLTVSGYLPSANVRTAVFAANAPAKQSADPVV